MSDQERRRDSRLRLVLPVRVQGTDAGGPWTEMAATDDASYGGCSFYLKHTVAFGNVLHLDLPLPKPFRRYDLQSTGYPSYALVRDLGSGPDGLRVGVMFIGKLAPKGYDANPAGLFLLPTDRKPAAKERRRHRRLDSKVGFRVKRTNGPASAPDPAEEQTVAENLGKRGARVASSLSVEKGDVLMLEEQGGAFRTRAEIKNVYLGPDNVPRLNLYFLDEEAPDRLVAAS
jgi:hypothetical protein